MNTEIDVDKVSGSHNAIYDAYYKQVDPKGTGRIPAGEAAKFLKKSGLSDVVLSRIWDLSDPAGNGYLDRAGLFIALKFVAVAQAGQDINKRNIYLETKAPKVGPFPKIMPQSIASIPPTNTDWSIKPADRMKYEKLFEDMKPVNGLLAGNAVRTVLMDSKLPIETLGKIWDLADQDKDGSLDIHEFVVAIHLVHQALEKRAIPTELPPQLERPSPISEGGFIANFPTEIDPPAAPIIPPIVPSISRAPPTIPSYPLIPSSAPIAPVTADWVVGIHDKIRYDSIFAKSDVDKDGLVSGMEIKDVFLQSGLTQNVLAHIWSLCDTNQSGKLTSDQFALAMWLVERMQNGIEPPQNLAPNMIPPSLRSNSSLISGNIIDLQPQIEPKPAYSNPELEMISKEIEELARERCILESDVAQREADIRIKTGEVRSLQSELDTLAATLKQLENQKGEAQKRLDDLKAQVNKIREQCAKQESTLKEQESELDSRRLELQQLKDEEATLEKEYDSGLKELNTLSKNLQDTQLQISQIKAMVSQLQECQRQMNDALALCQTAIDTNDPSIISDYSLKLEPEFRDAKQMLEEKVEKPAEVNDPFANNRNNGFSSGFDSDPFKSNGFSSDPFANSNGMQSSGFDDSFGSFDNKPRNDPFASSAAANAFGDSKSPAAHDAGKDEFGCDPFAILHAPTSASQIISPSPIPKSATTPNRSESPSRPELPPKKAKQPPPRPAPPRPTQGPSSSKPASDAFSSGFSSGGFADFADFDSKKNVVNKNADFSEDPFKDYRYEDPFSIEDPFSDDADPAEDPFSDTKSAILKEELNLHDNFSNKNINTINFNDTKDKNVFSDMFETQFNNENDSSSSGSIKNNSNNNTDTFNVNNKISLKTNDLFNPDEKNNNNSKTIKNDFFDAFNDNFSKSRTDLNANNKLNAFGDIKLETNTFGDGFDDEFSKMEIATSTVSATKNSNLAKQNNNNNINIDNFAKFDAFNDGDFNDNFNEGMKKKQNNEDSGEKLPTKTINKFASDYSKTDDFGSDLDAVLKRSLVEK